MNLYDQTVHGLHEQLKKKEISSVELTNAVYDRIGAVEDKVAAYVTLDKENALKQAARVDAMIAAGQEIKPLAGIPGAIKDNISVAGQPCGCASRILDGYRAPFDATVIGRLRAALKSLCQAFHIQQRPSAGPPPGWRTPCPAM